MMLDFSPLDKITGTNLKEDKRKALSPVQRLIESHLDFFIYDNACDYKTRVKTLEDYEECKRTLNQVKSLIKFAFNKIQEEEENESITWSKLDNAIEKQLQELDKLDKQLGDIKMSTTKGEEKLDKIYVPIYDNGEPYEDNYTYPENVCFKDFEACVKWIEEQCEDGVHYQRSGNFGRWELKLDKVDEEKCDILYPDGFYTIHEMQLKES